MTKVEYDKKPRTVDEMIELLKERGLIIKNENYVKKTLSQITYYRLSGYWFNYQNKVINKMDTVAGLSKNDNDLFNNKFGISVTFEDIVNVYKFDIKLRSLCLDALEKIEIAIGSIICDYMCNNYGGYWFENEINIREYVVNNTTVMDKDILKKELLDLVNKNYKTPCISNFKEKYIQDIPPYWIVSLLITFGLLSKIFSSLNPLDKVNIAKQIGVSARFLDDSLRSLSYIRNICAHYGRLWNRYIVMPPPNITFSVKGGNRYYIDFKNSRKFFPVFYIISYFLKIISPDTKWCKKVYNLINRYEKETKTILLKSSLVSFDKMGFIEEWDDLPLFQELLNNN